MPTITVPGHGDVEFPDSMKDEDVLAAVRKLVPPTVQAAPPGIGESLARGAGQGATLGFGDEINAGIQAAGIKLAGQTGAQKPLGQLYRENRDAFRRENAAAQAAHPYVYGAGQIAGGAPLALATGGGGTARLIGTSAALGGAAGLGEAQGSAGEQLKSTLFGAGLGGALAGAPIAIGKAVPAVRNALEEGAINTTRRILRNVGGSISSKNPLTADEIREVLNSGVVRAGGTSKGAAQRLEALREGVGGEYGGILSDLEKAGVTGPAPSVQQPALRAALRDPETGRLYTGTTHAEAFERMPAALQEGAAPVDEGFLAPGGKYLSREEASTWARANRPAAPTRVGPIDSEEVPKDPSLLQAYRLRAQEAAANSMNPAVPAAFENAAEQLSAKPTVSGRLGLSQAENLKRSLQGMAKSAYQKLEPGEVGEAHEAAASMMRQAIEDEIARQAPGAGPEAEAAAARFEPVKQRLGKIIAASNVAREGMARAANRNAGSLRDTLMASAGMGAGAASHGIVGGLIGGPAAGLASHALMERGPSTAVAAMRGGANALDYLTGPATTAAQRRTQALIQALRTRALPLAAEEAGGSTSR